MYHYILFTYGPNRSYSLEKYFGTLDNATRYIKRSILSAGGYIRKGVVVESVNIPLSEDEEEYLLLDATM